MNRWTVQFWRLKLKPPATKKNYTSSVWTCIRPIRNLSALACHQWDNKRAARPTSIRWMVLVQRVSYGVGVSGYLVVMRARAVAYEWNNWGETMPFNYSALTKAPESKHACCRVLNKIGKHWFHLFRPLSYSSSVWYIYWIGALCLQHWLVIEEQSEFKDPKGQILHLEFSFTVTVKRLRGSDGWSFTVNGARRKSSWTWWIHQLDSIPRRKCREKVAITGPLNLK